MPQPFNDIQLPARADAPEGVHGGIHLSKNTAGVTQERLTRGQQAHAARRALEELGAELIFERENVPTERRLREVEPASGAPHMPLLGHDNEGLDVRETHSRQG
jgi:hypothetical protein